jgi:excisionase family DNA binding protein
MQNNEILSSKETANFLRVSAPTLRRLAEKGQLRRIKLSPRRIGFLKTDIDAFLAKGGAEL